MKHLLFIFNARSGKAQVKEKLCSIVDFYFDQDYLVTLLPIRKISNMQGILETEKIDFIACAGGDGTLNSVVSASMQVGCEIPIGYLPMGSTNDFARTLGYDEDFSRSLRRSCLGEENWIDVGQINDRYFVYVAAFGSLAEVSYDTPQSIKNWLGHLAYILNGIQKITELKSYHIKVEADGCSVEDDFCMGFVMNSKSIGGFRSPLSDMVKLDDGMFEVFLIKTPQNILDVQRIIADLLSGNLQSEMYRYFQTGYLKMESEKINWTLDGEYGGTVDCAEIKNHKRAVRVVC